MRPWILTSAAAISAAIGVAAGVFWVRSHLLGPNQNGITCFDVGREPNRYMIQAYRGYAVFSGQAMKCDYVYGRLLVKSQIVVLPFWMIVLPLAILPAIWCARAWRRRRSWWAGRCRRCGYDLRASKDRCPECGTPFQQSTALS